MPLKVSHCTRTFNLAVFLQCCVWSLIWVVRPMVIVYSLVVFSLDFFSMFLFFLYLSCNWSGLAVRSCGHQQNWAGDHFVRNYIGSGGKCFMCPYVTFEASAFSSISVTVTGLCLTADPMEICRQKQLEDLWYYLSTLCSLYNFLCSDWEGEAYCF